MLRPTDNRFLQPEMSLIPPGSIKMRDDRIRTEWEVSVPSFYLAIYPVTRELYFAITGESPGEHRDDRAPVDTVSWLDAVRFCNQISLESGLIPCYSFNDINDLTFNDKANGYRLPDEAEWEYACKAGSRGPRYEILDEIAWYRGNSGGHSHTVGTLQPNNWGLYDMLGNVWEWCNDIYDEKVYGSYRIIKGGGWNDEERGILATNRRRSHPVSFKIDDLGFRIARKL